MEGTSTVETDFWIVEVVPVPMLSMRSESCSMDFTISESGSRASKAALSACDFATSISLLKREAKCPSRLFRKDCSEAAAL